MKWTRRSRSQNLEDRRAERARPRRRFPFPSSVRFPAGRAGGAGRRVPRIGWGGLLLLLLVFVLLRGNLGELLGGPTGGGQLEVPLPFPQAGDAPSWRDPSPGSVGAEGTPATTQAEEELVDFVSFVLDDVQVTWSELLPEYRDAKLVLFRDSVRSGCGFAAAQMGPFYCPSDEKVYIDLGFYDLLRRRFGAPGDFAQAYVLAHEIGHHVQRVLGVEAEVRRLQRVNPRAANQLSVRMELQADCFAGVWGHSTKRRNLLEPGDVEEGLGAAAAIGDDRMQQMGGGRIQPEAFTHGSSEERSYWLRRGLETGDPGVCDTFDAIQGP